MKAAINGKERKEGKAESKTSGRAQSNTHTRAPMLFICLPDTHTV